MRMSAGITSLMLAGSLALTGCATTTAKKPSELNQLRVETDASLRTLESRTAALEEEMKALTGLQEGIRVQLDELAKQQQELISRLKAAPAATPDEK